ncbi:hypothetical protein R6Q57_003734 [Mikania cordata]
MTKLFVFLLPLIITFSQTFQATGGDHNPAFLKSVKRNPLKLRTKKLSHFQFYWHDIISGPNPTVGNIIQPPKTNKTTPTGFGMVNMIDDPLTEKPETGSQLLGRAQGHLSNNNLEEPKQLIYHSVEAIRLKFEFLKSNNQHDPNNYQC